MCLCVCVCVRACMCACVCVVCVCVDTHQQNHYVTVDTHQPWTSMIVGEQPIGSKLNHIGMRVKKKKFQSWTYVGVGGSPWLDSTRTDTKKKSMVIRENWSVCPRLHVKFMKSRIHGWTSKQVCVCAFVHACMHVCVCVCLYSKHFQGHALGNLPTVPLSQNQTKRLRTKHTSSKYSRYYTILKSVPITHGLGQHE